MEHPEANRKERASGFRFIPQTLKPKPYTGLGFRASRIEGLGLDLFRLPACIWATCFQTPALPTSLPRAAISTW